MDFISELTMSLKNGPSFEGSINSENAGEVSLILDSSSKLTLTGDTYVKSLTNADTTNSNIWYTAKVTMKKGARRPPASLVAKKRNGYNG